MPPNGRLRQRGSCDAYEGEAPVVAPAGLKKENARKAIEFLKKLKEVCVAPVFVFTNEDVVDVEEQIKKHAELHTAGDPSHILVKSKGE
jgi:hypothetical protein